MRGNETIVIIPASGRDEYGDPTPAGPPVPVHNCEVLPRRVNSPERGYVLIDGYTVFAPPKPAVRAITARDAIIVRDGTFQVEGTPGEWRKRGEPKAVELVLKRVGT